MSKLLKRICAYLIDILLITTIAQTLSSTTIFNPNLNAYQKYQKQYNETYKEYATYVTTLTKYYDDNKLTEKEYNKLIEKNKTYESITNKYYQDSRLTKKNYNKLLKEVTKEYTTISQKIFYKIEKNSISEKIIYIVLVFLYFVGFNYITQGQTLGKKIMKLKIAKKNSNEKVPITSYLIRVILMYQTIYYIVRLITLLLIPASQYNSITNMTYNIQNLLDLAIITCMLVRKDGRGLHDLLAGTEVIKANKQ